MLAGSGLRTAGLAAIAVCGLASVAPAQQYWHDDAGAGALHLVALKPFLKGEGNQFLSGAVFLSGSARVADRVRLEAEVPMARAGFTPGTGPGESALRLGNPYLGIRFLKAGSDVSAQFGVRLPVAGDPVNSAGDLANMVGAMSDPDRLEAFAPKVLTARGAVEFRHVSPSGILIGLKAGPSLFVSTRSGAIGDKEELFAEYAARVGYQGTGILAAVGVTGRAWLTESDLSLSERTAHQLTGTVEGRKGRVRPTLLLRLPLDQSMRDNMDAVVGVGVTIAF